MNSAPLLFLILGLVSLTLGAEVLVKGASRLARRLGIPPLVIGLTVVAFGTSAPEVAVSVQAVAAGRPDVALGNVVGSNIFNVLLILGASAVVAPLAVNRQLVRLDVPIMIGVSALPLLLAWDASISRFEGGILIFLGAAYIATLAYVGLQAEGSTEGTTPGPIPARDEPSGARGRTGWAATLWESWLAELMLVGVGFGLLALGADWLVLGAATLARDLGISELVVGLTIIAAGTSLPELATSIVATRRGERDIAVGNVVGSNIFNILAVLGIASVAGDGLPIPPGVATFDFPLMFAVAVVCLPIFFTDRTIDRWEGATFVLYYALYVVYLVLHASGHEAEEVYRTVILLFVLPLTVIVTALVWYRRSTRTSGNPREST